jgi:hypothetical protein
LLHKDPQRRHKEPQSRQSAVSGQKMEIWNTGTMEMIVERKIQDIRYSKENDLVTKKTEKSWQLAVDSWQDNNRTMEQWNNGTLEQWNTGTMKHWNNETLEQYIISLIINSLRIKTSRITH